MGKFDFNPSKLFIKDQAASYTANIAGIGAITLSKGQLEALDGGGKVLRWQGKTPDGSAVFVKGLSGSIAGRIDTPRGQVLLGYANGEYIAYREAQGAWQSADNNIPVVLHPAKLDAGAASAQQKPAEVAYPMEFNAAGLSAVPEGGTVALSLPGAGDFQVIHDKTLPGDMGAPTFVGHLGDFGDDFRMIATYSPSGTEGMVLTPYGEYRLTTVNGQLWVVDVERSGLQSHTSEEVDAKAAPVETALAGANITTTTQKVTATATAVAPTASATTTVAAPASRIDVLVLYTDSFAAQRGSDAAALSRIQYLVAVANQSYKDSGVGVTLRLVGAQQVNGISDTVTESTVINDVTKGAGAFTTVAQLRKNYGADLVSVIRPFKLAQNACGVAWVGGYGGSNISAYASYGYSVVSDGTDSGYYCSDYSFVHELGHNMGSMHDRATVNAQGGGTGAYPYAFGYGSAGRFGTIMSYISPRIGKFSDPANLSCGGNQACGVDPAAANSADNAMSLNKTRTAVAAFTSEIANLPVAISGVISVGGKGKAGVAIVPSVSGISCTATGINGAYSCILPYGATGNLAPRLSGYKFTPASIPFSNLKASIAGQNSIGTVQ